MRKSMVFIAMGLAMTSTAMAETWVAICTDGQNFRYNQTVDGNGFLYLKGQQQSGGYQVARLEQTFFNGTAICGAVPGNGVGAPATGSNPITQICANRSRSNIYIKYKHPTEDRPFESDVFCEARVDVR